MKRILSMFALAFAAALLWGAAPASAASLTDAQALANAASSGVVKVGGCLGYGCDGYYRHRSYVYEEDDRDDDEYAEEDEPDYPERNYSYYRSYSYHSSSGGSGYCGNCQVQCADGYCPPHCRGWWHGCRRDRW